jgi:curved DNA-binding protein
MKFKDYYQTLGVARDASTDDIKRAYRKLARKYHPDLSKEADAEARFKDLGEANEVLKDPEKRAAYDQAGSQWERQRQSGGNRADQDFQPPPGWDAGFEFSGRGDDSADPQDHSDFFEALFGRAARGGARAGGARAQMRMPGQDHHAKVLIDLEDAYRGAQRSVSLRMPALDAQGHGVMQERRLDVNIPKGIREGQHLRLAGQGGPGLGEGPAGDLFLEIAFNPHPVYRTDGRDVYFDLPVAPWEAALGVALSAPTPDGPVELTIPPGSAAGRKLRLKGRGLPGNGAGAVPGDLYAVLTIALPKADTEAAKSAYRVFAEVFADASGFKPRAHLEG